MKDTNAPGGVRLLVMEFCAIVILAAGARHAAAQTSTRMLLASGASVPGHAGFMFGPFSDVVMNARRQIVFRSSLLSPRSAWRALVRSSGVTFSVVAFQGLVSPLSGLTFDSFSAPSLNGSGVIAFSAALTGGREGAAPSFGVFRAAGDTPAVLAASGQSIPGNPAATFLEFSSPVVGSSGSVLFGARISGVPGSSGLFLWTSDGLKSVLLPADLRLAPSDLLVPVFVSQDESVWVRRGISPEWANDQFFRAVANKTFQQLNPPPELSDTVQVLPSASEEKPVQLLLVLLEGERAETAELQGDPTQPVLAKQPPGPPLDLPLAAIQGQVPGSISGSVVFAAAPLAHQDDLAFYCFCGGQITRLTTPQDFMQLEVQLGGRSILSLAGDAQQTVAFIAPNGPGQDTNAIYVTSLP